MSNFEEVWPQFQVAALLNTYCVEQLFLKKNLKLYVLT